MGVHKKNGNGIFDSDLWNWMSHPRGTAPIIPASTTEEDPQMLIGGGRVVGALALWPQLPATVMNGADRYLTTWTLSESP